MGVEHGKPAGHGEGATLGAEPAFSAHARGSRLLQHLWSSPMNMLGAVFVLAFVVQALIGRAVAPYPPTVPDYSAAFGAPSLPHLFGTDEVGRDVFSRVLSGASTAMEIILVVVGFGALFGTLVGLVSGYAGGWTDEVLMRITDIFLAFPVLVLAIAIASILGPSLSHTMLALAVLWWPWYARLLRGQVLALREREYIEAARAMGVPPFRILWRHLLPNAMGALLVQVSLDCGYALLAASSLSFIGLGVQQPQPDWGLMVNDAQPYLRSDWWLGAFPGLAIVLAVLGFNLLGDALGDLQEVRHVR